MGDDEWTHRLSSFISLEAVWVSKPVVGSSRNITDGSVISSMPMLVRFLSPPEIPRVISVPTWKCTSKLVMCFKSQHSTPATPLEWSPLSKPTSLLSMHSNKVLSLGQGDLHGLSGTKIHGQACVKCVLEGRKAKSSAFGRLVRDKWILSYGNEI